MEEKGIGGGAHRASHVLTAGGGQGGQGRVG